MKIILAILIGISVNLDNMIIGLNLGFKKKTISVTTNIIISMITALLTYISCVIASSLSRDILKITNILGAFILICFGFWCLKPKTQQEAKEYNPQSLKEIIIFGWILAVNCIPPSFSAGVMGLNSIILSLCAGLTSFLFMYITNKLGAKIADTGKFNCLEPLSAWVLIFIGFMELLI